MQLRTCYGTSVNSCIGNTTSKLLRAQMVMNDCDIFTNDAGQRLYRWADGCLVGGVWHVVRGCGAIQGTIAGVVAFVGDEGVRVSRCGTLSRGGALLLHHLFAVVLSQVIWTERLTEWQFFRVSDPCNEVKSVSSEGTEVTLNYGTLTPVME